MSVSHAVVAGLPGGVENTSSVALKDRFDIALEPLAEPIGSPHAAAHAARSRLNSDHALFALVCDPELPPRLDVLERLRNFSLRSLLRLLDSGIVPWPETGDHRFVVVYERPPGPKLVPNLSIEFGPMAEGDIINRVITPLAGLLEQLAAMGVTHGGIRPTNLFVGPDKKGPVTVGENASAPGWFCQPAVFCPIEMLQAMPAGRGTGTIADDIYALGATALTLLLGKNPAAGRDDAALLQEKMERGSFATLAGQNRLPAALREALRGMLDDRPRQRWTLDDIKSWLTERRIRSLHNAHLDRAQRPFTLNGKSYHHARPLAHALATDWDKVQLADKGHEILGWARRGLCDDAVAGAVLAAMEHSERVGELADPAFVSRLVMALDHGSPVRYRHISAHVGGFGPLMAASFHDTETIRALTEAILEELPGFHHRLSGEDGASAQAMKRLHAGLGRVLKNPTMGFGVERCLYELNPFQYCHSPLVAGQKVMEIGKLLPALEKVANQPHKGPPFDRHIAAFIASRLEVDLSQLLEMASDPKDPERAVLGWLGVLGTLQTQAGPVSLPGLARWIGGYLRPAIDGFHHKMWREKVEGELPGLLDRGDIAALYLYLANGETRQRDRRGYAAAVAQYAKLSAEISFLRSLGYNDPRRAEEYGHQLAAGLTGLICMAAMIFTFVLMW